MLWVRLACGGLLLGSVLTVYNGLNEDRRTSPATDRYVTYGAPTPTVSTSAGESYTVDEVESDVRVDRYGNRIDRAFGDYRVDPRGELFESHSPNTAVARLSDPST